MAIEHDSEDMSSWFSRILGFTGNVIKYGCITHCTFEYLGDFVVCSGPSMEPTLHSDDILLTERISPRLLNISKGDIIIAKCPTNPNVYICKRVIGLSGDKIVTPQSFSEMINNEINSTTTGDSERLSMQDKLMVSYVPKGQVWLEGDNQLNSTDSRIYGPVPEGLIKSRVLCRLWPINKMKMLT